MNAFWHEKCGQATDSESLFLRGIRPIDLAGLLSEGGEVIKLRTEGYLMIPTTGIVRV